MTSQEQEYLICLTGNHVAMVDGDDCPALSRHRWFAHYDPKMRGYYAVRNDPNGRRHGGPKVLMHRQIMGLQHGDKRQVDHINGNTLDNRRVNLRIATGAENKRNARTRKDNSCGFKGVHYHKRDKYFVARISFDGKRYEFRGFQTAKEAHEMYCEQAKKLHGTFARVI